jgi:pimeloyl-ACP methyl ester carboxylesterase
MPTKPQQRFGVESRFADVNGTGLHYLAAGQAEPAILLHGYIQTSNMWRPLVASDGASPIFTTPSRS